MMKSPELSICIVNLNSCDYLRDCLASLYQSTSAGQMEVIVVDNGSTDGSVDWLRQNYPQVRLILNQKNLGYTYPMNQALRAASGRYCAQLNPDTVIDPHAFETLIAFMDVHPEIGICTPKVLNRDGTLQKQCRRSAARPWDTIAYFSGLAKRFPQDKRFAGYLKTYLDENEINEVEAVSGSCMLIRREVFDQIGYLDEDFFAYQEDADFCFRAREAGWKIYYNPQAQITHYGGEGGSKVQVYRGVYEWHRSYYLYYRKHLAKDYFFLFNWLYYAVMLGKLGVSMTATFFRKNKFVGTRKP